MGTQICALPFSSCALVAPPRFYLPEIFFFVEAGSRKRLPERPYQSGGLSDFFFQELEMLSSLRNRNPSFLSQGID